MALPCLEEQGAPLCKEAVPESRGAKMRSLRPAKMSVLRRVMMWMYGSPSRDPYITISLDIELEEAQQYLERREARTGEHVGIHHFLTAAVARCFQEYPSLNRKILGSRIYDLCQVDIVMPVNLVGHGHDEVEASVIILEAVERMSLEDIARATRRKVREEHKDKHTSSLVGLLRWLGDRGADRLLYTFLDGVGRLGGHPLGYRLLQEIVGVSTTVSNVGAVLPDVQGAHFRGAALTMPDSVMHVGSFFGVAPATRRPVACGEQIVLRQVLPLIVCFDHRLIDGFLFGKTLQFLASIFCSPDEYFPLPD